MPRPATDEYVEQRIAAFEKKGEQACISCRHAIVDGFFEERRVPRIRCGKGKWQPVFHALPQVAKNMMADFRQGKNCEEWER